MSQFLVCHNLSSPLEETHFILASIFIMNINVMEISVSFYHEICDQHASEPVAVYTFVMLQERYSYLPLHKNIFY